MTTLAALLHCEVVDESGHRLGHVRDVRLARDGARAGPEQAPPYRVEGLVVGRRGLAARLGLRAARHPEPLHPHDPIPWERVVEVAGGRIVVRASR